MAGRVILAATGIQDQWLTGEPQFSYFVMNYKKHTRFATEAVEIPFSGEKKLGGYAEVRIPNNVGDLIRSMMLKMTLTPLKESSDPLVSNLYNTSLTSSIIDYADLRIGGQTIERVTGDYIYMYNQLYNNTDDLEQTLYFLSGHNNHLNVSNSFNTFYLTLPFYFYRHSSLAIPVCAITKQLVEVYVKFKDANEDISFTYTTSGSDVSRQVTSDAGIRDISLITDFFFISEDERNFLKTRPMEYIITQLQKSTIQFKPNESKKSALLKFKHPVKELMFLAKEETSSESTNLLDVTSPDQSFSTRYVGKRSDHRLIKKIRLECNGEGVFDDSGLCAAYQESLQYHTGCPNPAYEFYTHSFALKPEEYYPTGQLNMSRIIHKKLDVELGETSSTRNINVSVYAINYNILQISSGLAGLKF
jgi:hypothetical protein